MDILGAARRHREKEKNTKARTAAAKRMLESLRGNVTSEVRRDLEKLDPVYAAHFDAMQLGADCLNCPLYGCRRGPVPSKIVKNPKLTIIGEAPGGKEVEAGANFVGPSGQELDTALSQAGMSRRDANILNTIMCQPPPGDSLEGYLTKLNRKHKLATERANKEGVSPPKPPITPMGACSKRLINELTNRGSSPTTTTILAVGGRALKAMADYFGADYARGKDSQERIKIASIKNQHGSPVVFPKGHILPHETGPVKLKEDHILCSSLHPAFAMRGHREYKGVVRSDIARGAKIAMRGTRISWVEPKFHIFLDEKGPKDYKWSISEIERICALFLANKKYARVTVDIEGRSPGKYFSSMTCSVDCVGMGMNIAGDEVVVVIPLKYMTGEPYWPNPKMQNRARECIRQVMDECELVMHNGMFDTLVLLLNGLMTERAKTWFDTLLAHKNTDHNDLPHKLGFVASRFLEVPMWKGDVDHKDASNTARDLDLYVYNAKDVLTTMRLHPILKDRVVGCGTKDQFLVDSDMAPVAREMQELGVFVNEYERGMLSVKFNKLTHRFRTDFANTVRDVTPSWESINPNSPPQLATWLYEDLGLEPLINTSGYEYDEGDAPSTGAPAITKLLEAGVEPRVQHALETLLSFKSCEKLRSTYIDNLKTQPAPDFGYPKAKAARFLTNPDHVKAYAAEHNMTPREAAKLVGEVIETLPERPAFSRIHATWKLHGTRSGRWSSSPNMQNQPARCWDELNMRTVIVAPPGHALVGADFEQIELRIYALESGDEFLLKAFSDLDKHGKPLDPHTMNAATLFCESRSPTMEDIMRKYYELKSLPKGELKYYRTIAKRFAYLETYGGSEDKLYDTMSNERDKVTGELVFPNITQRECEIWHKNWHKLHPETKAWQRRCAIYQRRHGYVSERVHGRKRYFLGGPNQPNAVPNHTIQGCAAGIMNTGLMRVVEAIPFRSWSKYTGVCMQVHDYLGVYVPVSRIDETIKIINKCLHFEIDGMQFPVDTPIASWDWASQG